MKRNFEVSILRALTDNYIYAIHLGAADLAIVDPSTAAEVLAFTKSRGLNVSLILNTHHHFDHVGGNLELAERFHCQVVGSHYDKDRIPGLTRDVGEADSVQVGNHTAKILDIPGHTLGHIAYFFEEPGALFVGDSLFAMSVGRNFEGTLEALWKVVQKLKTLPPETRVYCGHEYALRNFEFAFSLDLKFDPIPTRFKAASAKIKNGEPFMPLILEEEWVSNPFFMTHKTEVKNAVGLAEGATEFETFCRLRERRNQW